MTWNFKRTVALVAGWSLIALGVLGLVLPILPGMLLLLAGISVLSSEYVWAHKILQRLRGRFPGLSKQVHAAEARVLTRLKSIFSHKSEHSSE
jgi:uncharacterized membrane protein YbaN (DUF454 family)